MKDTEMALHWKKEVDAGKNIVIYDFDGPREDDGDVTCIEINEKMLKEKINDTRFPFGHGYIVAAFLAGIENSKFI
jgi:3,4-dihydroxy-2-butanone 4-phosphate synthase